MSQTLEELLAKLEDEAIRIYAKAGNIKGDDFQAGLCYGFAKGIGQAVERMQLALAKNNATFSKGDSQ